MSYLGSKAQAGVFQTIIGNMPPHSVYIEPFFGSGQIFWRKLPAAANVIIDADAGVLARLGVTDREKNCNLKLAINGVSGVPVRVICDDALSQLGTLALTLPPGALVYCDPPYLLCTRTSRHRYKHEFTNDQHEELLTLLQASKANVMISGYPSELYGRKLAGWRRVTYRTRTRGRSVTECLWCNFPEPVELHDWRYAGKNFRERLMLKRRVVRLQSKLDALSPRHRGFVLDAIRQRYFQRGATATIAEKDVAR